MMRNNLRQKDYSSKNVIKDGFEKKKESLHS